jgi:cytidylate kinase
MNKIENKNRRRDTMGYNVAIDGPAGAGKSTIAKLVAKEKGYIYVDTGAMYRGLAIHFLDKGIQPQETEKVIEACKDAEVTIAYEDAVQHVYLNGKDISSRLRNEEVGNMASVTSAIPEVRKKLLELQQNLAKTQNVIMDGRDIGTCVLPHADVKVYLTASVETRAKRRYQELQEKGEDCNLEEIAHDIEERDRRDMTREIAPLKQAEDAVLVDSSDMTIAEVVKTIVDLCR